MTGNDVRNLHAAALHIWNNRSGSYDKGSWPIRPEELWVKDAKQLTQVAKELNMEKFDVPSFCGMLVRYDVTMPDGEACVKTEGHSHVLSWSTLVYLRPYTMKVEIEDVNEALKWLNFLIKQGKLFRTEGMDSDFIQALPWEKYGRFVTAYRILVPAMIEETKGLLELYRGRFIQHDDEYVKAYYPNGPDAGELTQMGICEGIELALIRKARDYAPAMVELGWVPK